MESKDLMFILAELQDAVPKRPFTPNVVDVAAAAFCPRSALLKLVYGAAGEYNAGLAIGTVTHSVLAELGRVESSIVNEIDIHLSLDMIARKISEKWINAASGKIEESWRLFADAQISANEGRNAVLQRLHGFSHHLAEEIKEGYQQPDKIVTGHHIINLDLPLEGVPDEYRIFHDPFRIEIREFKTFGGSKIKESARLQACGYQLLLEQIYSDADFNIKVISTDDVAKVRMTDTRRNHLYEGINVIQEIYEKARGRAKRIPNICEICHVADACQYYFQDTQPPHIRKYLWRLRMETLEEKGLNQIWKWKSKILPLDARIQLGYSDGGYQMAEVQPHKIRLLKDGGTNNILRGDTVIVSGGNPLTTPSFTGEISELQKSSVTIMPYGEIPLGLPTTGLTIDHYDVDMTRRQLKSIDAIHRSTGRQGELTRRILGTERPISSTLKGDVEFAGNLNPKQRQAVISALNAPDFSVVLGPPGTGKTAVIVEILIQLARQGKRALAVSVANAAVDNIVERLLNLGHRFGIRFGNYYKIREHAMQAALINILTNDEDLALAAVEKMRTAAAVLTTCSSASLDLVKAGRFDVVIFEESSQIRMQDAFAALVQADKAIIIGDDKQLPPVSQLHRPISSLLKISLGTLKRYNLATEFVTPLQVQYRMHKQICDLINRIFYDNNLVSNPIIEKRPPLPVPTEPTGFHQLDRVLDPKIVITVIDVEGIEEYRGHSTLNRSNIEVDSILVNSLRSSGLTSNQIGVITPYKEQQMLLVPRIGNKADAGTVDSFQGQERDVIILDLVRANPDREAGFTLEPNRLNVALSRARDKLIIVADLQTFTGHPIFDKIVDYVRSLPNTCIEQITANQLGIKLPEYKKRMEIQIIPEMVDKISESPEQPASGPIPKKEDYFDVY